MGADNGSVSRCHLERSGPRPRAILRWGRHGLLGGLPVAALLTGCAAGVNDELVSTPTPYPVRPTVADTAGTATPGPDAAAALATAEAALERGDPTGAEAILSRTIESGLATADVLALRAAARQTRGDLDGARRDLDAAIALAPDRADPYQARAEIAERRGDLAAAVADLDAAVARAPGDPRGYVERGQAIARTAVGDVALYQRALDDVNRALALDAGYGPARLGRVRILLDRAAFRGDPADPTRALAELDAAVGGGEAAALLRAQAFAAAGDAAEARRVLAAPVIATASEEPVGAGERAATEAAVALAAREWDAAAATALDALRAEPSRWAAFRLLAEAELGRGDADAALAAAERLLERRPDDGPGLFLRGAALLRLGRETEAWEVLGRARRALAASPVYQARIEQLLPNVSGTPGG